MDATANIQNPQLNAQLTDTSKTDESVTQSNMTINASNGSVINTNSGNEHSGRNAHTWMWVMGMSILCDLIILGFICWTSNANTDRLIDVKDSVVSISRDVKAENDSFRKEMETTLESSCKHSKEGIIWILRRDILNSIDYHESSRTITQKQYKRIKDQFDYYRSIGGNHDVEGRFDDFNTKIMGTKEITMTAK